MFTEQLILNRRFKVLSYDTCVLLKDHIAVTPVRLETAALRSPVKHSTTEPLRSLVYSQVPVHIMQIDSMKSHFILFQNTTLSKTFIQE